MPMFPNLWGNVSVLLKLFVRHPHCTDFLLILQYAFPPGCASHHTAAFLSTSFLSKAMAFFVIQCYNKADTTVLRMMQPEGGRYSRICTDAELKNHKKKHKET